MKKKSQKKNMNYVIIFIIISLSYFFIRQKKNSTLELIENSKINQSLKLNLKYIARDNQGMAYSTSSFTGENGKQHTIKNVGTKENITVFSILDTQNNTSIGSELFYDRSTKQIFICLQDGGEIPSLGKYGFIIKGTLSYNSVDWRGGGSYFAANRIGWTKDNLRQWQPGSKKDNFTEDEGNNFLKYKDEKMIPYYSTNPNIPVDGTYIIATINE